ncbi:hypothetical protein Tco_0472814 [Tanacetum coccineum]
MDDPNITMEEYIRLEEEKARKHGKVFNWETAKYGRIWYDEDVHDLRSVETEFPAIIFNDNLTSIETLYCEPTVSSLNDNEIDFRISFDEFDNEDYTIVYDENSFSYKIISVNNLKTDYENDNEKVNMPSFSSPEPEEPSERNDNVGGVFINLEISKCWSLEIPRRLFNTPFCSNIQNGESFLRKISREFPRSNSISHII